MVSHSQQRCPVNAYSKSCSPTQAVLCKVTNPYEPPQKISDQKAPGVGSPHFASTPFDTSAATFAVGLIAWFIAAVREPEQDLQFWWAVLPDFLPALARPFAVVLITCGLALLPAGLLGVLHVVALRRVHRPRMRTVLNVSFLALVCILGWYWTVILLDLASNGRA